MQGGCRVGAGWVQGGCRVGAGWVQGGCRVGAGWGQGGCRVGAGWGQGGCRVGAGMGAGMGAAWVMISTSAPLLVPGHGPTLTPYARARAYAWGQCAPENCVHCPGAQPKAQRHSGGQQPWGPWGHGGRGGEEGAGVNAKGVGDSLPWPFSLSALSTPCPKHQLFSCTHTRIPLRLQLKYCYAHSDSGPCGTWVYGGLSGCGQRHSPTAKAGGWGEAVLFVHFIY